MEHGADIPAVKSGLTEAERVACPTTAHPALDRFLAGMASAEVTIMQLLLACGGLESVFRCVDALRERREVAELARTATAHRDGLERTAALVAAGLVEERNGIDAIRNQFDRAVALAPEASVALYSLGTPETLARATAEIVDRLRRWSVIYAGCRVLDIGCGIGRIEQALAPDAGAITGIDVSAGMIVEARRRCAGLANVSFRRCGGTDLAEFDETGFDLVLAVDSFPYLVAADPAIAVRHVADAARLLRPDGALVIFNYSYSGALDADRRVVAQLGSQHSLAVERNGTRDLSLWDGATFLLRKPK
jgi:SAM-dependent methyltransferase